jgi:hypothetical protein
MKKACAFRTVPENASPFLREFYCAVGFVIVGRRTRVSDLAFMTMFIIPDASTGVHVDAYP